MRQDPPSRDRSAEPPGGAAPSDGGGDLTFPAGLLLTSLALQLLLLAWSAFPAETMKSDQPLESWFFLVGGQALLFSWLWPLVRIGSRASGVREGAGQAGGMIVLRPWRQAGLEAVLLAASGIAPALAAAWWVDASAGQVLAPAVYLLLWLLVGWLGVGMFSRAGSVGGCPGRLAAGWVFAAAAMLTNFGLFALGYLHADFLGGDAAAFGRFSPMAQAARLAEIGWPAHAPDQLAFAFPVAAALLLAALAVLLRTGEPQRPGRRSDE